MFGGFFERKGYKNNTVERSRSDLERSIKEKFKNLKILNFYMGTLGRYGSGPDGYLDPVNTGPDEIIKEIKNKIKKGYLNLEKVNEDFHFTGIDMQNILSGHLDSQTLRQNLLDYIGYRFSKDLQTSFTEQYVDPLIADVAKFQEGMEIKERTVEITAAEESPRISRPEPVAVVEEEIDPGTHDPELVKSIKSRFDDLETLRAVVLFGPNKLINPEGIEGNSHSSVNLAPEVLISKYKESGKKSPLVQTFKMSDILAGKVTGEQIKFYFEGVLNDPAISNRSYYDIQEIYLNPLLADIEKLSFENKS